MILESERIHRIIHFRWKNLDKNIEDDERKRLSDDEGGSDDDNEDSEWRKQKIEREKFLQEQKAKV